MTMTSITASTTRSATTTSTATNSISIRKVEQQKQFVRNNHNSFPIKLKSKKLYEQGKRFQNQKCYQKAIIKYLRGAEMTGCIHCIFEYIELIRFVHHDHQNKKANNIKANNKNSNLNNATTTTIHHLILPWLLEGAIRGHLYSIIRLYCTCYTEALPSQAHALIEYWLKIEKSLYPSLDNNHNDNNKSGQGNNNNNNKTIKDGRQKAKKTIVSSCPICHKTDDDVSCDDDSISNDNDGGDGSTGTGMTEIKTKLKQCMGCKMYCYFSEECQTTHWIKQNHRNECKMIQILQKYHKPYSKEIHQNQIIAIHQQQQQRERERELFRSSDDQSSSSDFIDSNNKLQILRDKLGLNRPKIDYEELKLLLSSDNDNDNDDNDNNDRRRHYLVARQDGTVHIGSTPNVI
jgi:hypothetical protein